MASCLRGACYGLIGQSYELVNNGERINNYAADAAEFFSLVSSVLALCFAYLSSGALTSGLLGTGHGGSKKL